MTLDKYDEHYLRLAIYEATILSPKMYTDAEKDYYQQYYNKYLNIVARQQQQAQQSQMQIDTSNVVNTVDVI